MASSYPKARAEALLVQAPNKQLERTVIRRHVRAACASFHCGHAARWTVGHAAAQLRRWAHMSRVVPISICCLVAAAVMAGANAQVPAPLESLAQQLQQLRALERGAPSRASCPEDTRGLVGLRQDAVHRALGEPDFLQGPSKWTYFLSSPLPQGQLGGGFPELTFTFNAQAVVAEVTCHYAR